MFDTIINRMVCALFKFGTWPYRFMNKLPPVGLLVFFGISFLLYVAMYYIGKMLSHLRWGGKPSYNHLLNIIVIILL